VFVDFGKEDSEWFDGRGTKCLMTDWLIKENFQNTSPCRYEEVSWQLRGISLAHF
jgi:hypothetical protein